MFIFGVAGILLVILITIGTLLFYNPTYLVNARNIDYALKKTSFLQSWSWSTGEINHKWIKWNHRQFDGHFKNLCLVYARPQINIDTCMEDISWNLDLKWNFGEGFTFLIKRPLVIDSKKTKISLYHAADDSNIVPNYFRYWDKLWSKVVPDLDFNFRSIDILKDDKIISFDLRLKKMQNNLVVTSLNYELSGTSKRITILAPRKIIFPYDLNTKKMLYLNDLKLIADLEKPIIPVRITGGIDDAKLNIQTMISKKLLTQNRSKDFVLKQILLQTSGNLEIEKLSSFFKKLMRAPFNILPAPFNSMEGTLNVKLMTANMENKESEVMVKLQSSLDMKGANQFLVLDVLTDFPFKFKDKKIGAVSIGLDFKKVYIRLPKLSKTKIPQLRPDPRFKGVKTIAENVSVASPKNKKLIKKIRKKVSFTINLQALGDGALQINTNLLDEILRLNFDLEIENKTVQDGYVEIKPLRTTVFKRPIYIPVLKITFNAPLSPQIVATIEFHLPEYLVTLRLEGPLSKPRTAFSSIPPLPQDDIIAVLLFGRPLSDLNPDDKTATKDASQIISQSVLSLAVLYYLAGSPVESIGYDPDTKVVSAQFGLGRKNALHLESERGALSSYGVRHSLGKGWYVDSTIQKSTDVWNSGANDYGVLLERVISY